MTSPAKLRANRRNAAKGTGPKTAAGKARAARNARRHGFNLPVLADPGCSGEIDDLARTIETSATGGAADPRGHDHACEIAGAIIDLRRVREAKLPLVAALHADPKKAAGPLRELMRLDRYERPRPVAAQASPSAHSSPPSRRPPHPPRAKRTQRRNPKNFKGTGPACTTPPTARTGASPRRCGGPPCVVDHVGDAARSPERSASAGPARAASGRTPSRSAARSRAGARTWPRSGAADHVEEPHAAARIGAPDRYDPALVVAVAQRLVPHDLERRLVVEDRLGGAPVRHHDQVDLLLLHQLLGVRFVRPPHLHVRLDAVEAGNARGTSSG